MGAEAEHSLSDLMLFTHHSDCTPKGWQEVSRPTETLSSAATFMQCFKGRAHPSAQPELSFAFLPPILLCSQTALLSATSAAHSTSPTSCAWCLFIRIVFPITKGHPEARLLLIHAIPWRRRCLKIPLSTSTAPCCSQWSQSGAEEFHGWRTATGTSSCQGRPPHWGCWPAPHFVSCISPEITANFFSTVFFSPVKGRQGFLLQSVAATAPALPHNGHRWPCCSRCLKSS